MYLWHNNEEFKQDSFNIHYQILYPIHTYKVLINFIINCEIRIFKYCLKISNLRYSHLYFVKL